MTRSLGCAALVAAIGLGCGGPNDAEPRLIPSGGVGDGAIDGRINVYVIDAATDEPIAGADVRIGEPDETPIEGSTDSAGLFTIDDDSLEGPTTITATASGYVPGTWFGVNGANVTIAIAPTSATDIPQAELTGGITDWETLPVPADQNHVLIANVGYSRTAQLFDAENELDPPGDSAPCIVSAVTTTCEWSINARTGNVSVFANILDVDTKGTFLDTSDDTFVAIGFAYALDITVVDGVDQSGIMLEMVDTGALTNAVVDFPAAPAGLPEVLGLTALELGDSGTMIMLLPFGPDNDTYAVPALTGPFADGTYQLLASASLGDASEEPASVTITRGFDDPASIAAPDFLVTPTGLAEASGELSFTPVDGASLHVVELRNSIGVNQWGLTFLDGRTTFTLPALDPDPLPTGTVEYVVSALVWDADLGDFVLDDAVQTVSALASEITTFEN